TQRPTGLPVEDHFYFGEIEVERAMRETAAPKERGQFPGSVEVASELIVRRALQERIGLFVSEPARALDERAGETRATRRAVFRAADENGVGQPNDVRVQAANAVAQPLGQHRDDT